jgi:hypothetical protein
MRPGLEKETQPALLFLPFFVPVTVALVMLFCRAPSVELDASSRDFSFCGALGLPLIVRFGPHSVCGLSPGASSRRPTRLRLIGEFAGVVAGGLGTVACASNCTSDTIAFFAVCYSAAIAIGAFIGAQLGPRLYDDKCRPDRVRSVTDPGSASNSLT